MERHEFKDCYNHTGGGYVSKERVSVHVSISDGHCIHSPTKLRHGRRAERIFVGQGANGNEAKGNNEFPAARSRRPEGRQHPDTVDN